MSKKPKFLTSPLTAAIAAALYPTGHAIAQDQDEDAGEDIFAIEEVIVTATFREVSMQDLPQSVQAFTGADIERAAFTDFTDIANAIPSLTLIADMPGRNSVKFRGISTGTGEYYTDSLMAIYLDETPLTFNSQQLWPAMVDVERVESLPGPQGTLFGSASIAGTLRVITNKPNPNEWSGEVYGEYYSTDGGDGSWELNGHINIPLIQDTLGLRLVGYTRDEGGWIDNVYGEPYVRPAARFSSLKDNSSVMEDNWNTYTLTGGRASLLWDISRGWDISLTFLSENGEADGAWGDDSHLGEYQTAMFHKEFRNDEWWNASLLLHGDLGFATLTSSTTFLDREITYEWDRMVYEQWKDSFWGYYYGFVLYNSQYTYGNIFNDQTQDRFSQEIRLASQGESNFEWMIGAFYEKVNDDWYYGTINNDMMQTYMWEYAQYWAYYYNYYDYPVQYPMPPTNVAYSDTLDRTNTQKAVFGEVSLTFAEKWRATLGFRWFDFERDRRTRITFPETLPPWGAMDTNGQFREIGNDSDTVWKASLQYFATEDLMVYGLFSEGFRAGGSNSFRSVVQSDGFFPFDYGPDSMENYELGTKMDILDGRMRFNIVAFRMDWGNKQYNQFENWWLNGTKNGGATQTDGLEVDWQWQATEDLRLEARVTYLDGENTERVELIGGDTIEPGDPIPNAPELAYYVSVDYTFPWQPWGGVLWGRADYAYGDGYWISTGAASSQDPEGWRPEWDNTNLQLGLALPDQWTITAYVNNLTNERRVNGRDNNSYASDWFGNEDYRYRNYRQRPRTIGMSVRKAFN